MMPAAPGVLASIPPLPNGEGAVDVAIAGAIEPEDQRIRLQRTNLAAAGALNRLGTDEPQSGGARDLALHAGAHEVAILAISRDPAFQQRLVRALDLAPVDLPVRPLVAEAARDYLFEAPAIAGRIAIGEPHDLCVSVGQPA